MRDDDILIGSLMEESWLTLEQVAAACMVEPAWLLRHLEEGLFPHAESIAGTWRFSGTTLIRARRMRQLERDFDAAPELAALVADLLEEMDELRVRVRAAVKPSHAAFAAQAPAAGEWLSWRPRPRVAIAFGTSIGENRLSPHENLSMRCSATSKTLR